MATFAIGTDSFVIAGILPEVARSLDVSVGSAGQLVTAYALTYALLSPVIAVVTARWSRERLLLTGVGLFILANVAAAVAPTFGLVLLSRVVAGIGGAAVTPVALAAGASLVPPEKRGTALSIVGGGVAVSSALGVPLGAAIGGWSDWRVTMWFVAALGLIAAVGIGVFLRDLPAPFALTLRQRLSPLKDSRVALVLATTIVVFTGNFTLNVYVSQAFGRATGGEATTLALLLFLSGLAGVVGSLGSGPLTDRFGSRRVFNIAVGVSILNFALLPWTSANLGLAIAAVIVWGVFGWSQLVPQQHRLILISPQSAPLAISLNSSVVFIGASLSGVVGAIALTLIDARYLGFVGAAFFAVGLAIAQIADAAITRHTTPAQPPATATPEPSTG
ncbi:MFS transporter [Sphaerisporangium aureirubrum]|uniref:MFS transporter n=1 Tax=Sphaerisporangium aureirubrum TaxID=1544736 RepID=A0ABW1NP85_9ACTN